MSFDIINSDNLSKISYFFFKKKQLQLARMARQQLKYYSLLLHRFTHETEKDKTRNVLLGVTNLRISKLGISKTEKLV